MIPTSRSSYYGRYGTLLDQLAEVLYTLESAAPSHYALPGTHDHQSLPGACVGDSTGVLPSGNTVVTMLTRVGNELAVLRTALDHHTMQIEALRQDLSIMRSEWGTFDQLIAEYRRLSTISPN